MVTLKGSTPEYFGVSTDEKSTNAPVNSIFTELDTADRYYFNGETWEAIGAESEG